MTKRKTQQRNPAPVRSMVDTAAHGWVDGYQPIGFMGYRLDQKTGCYHLGNGYRLFNPQVRAFYSPDNLSPFGAGGISRYHYCNLDPVNRKDPSGHAALTIISLILTTISVGLSISAMGVNLAAWKYRNEDPEYAEKLMSIGIGLNIAAAITGLAGAGFGAAGGATIKQNANHFALTMRKTIGVRPVTHSARFAASLQYQSGLPNLLGAVNLKLANMQPILKASLGVAAVSAISAGGGWAYRHNKASLVREQDQEVARQAESTPLQAHMVPPSSVSQSTPPPLPRQSWGG